MKGECLYGNKKEYLRGQQGKCDKSNGLTDNAPQKDAETELSFNLRPWYSFCFASKYVPVDILTQ